MPEISYDLLAQFQILEILLMSTENEIPTIEEYLQLSDWTLSVSVSEGSHSNFFWLRSSHLGAVDLLETIDLPKKPFRVLITYWDWRGGGASTYGSEAGWRELGEYAISDVSTVLPKLHYGADNAQMVLDESIADREILHALANFDEPYKLDDLEGEHTKKFWAALEALKPYCYFSYGLFDGFTFVARGHDLRRQFLDSISQHDIEAIYRDKTSATRARMWEELGPECGPETCIEANCERQRIRLAVRCFIHQIRWGST